MIYRARPLTPDLWPQLEELFGPVGACNGCWCMYWRIGSAYTQRPRAKNRADFKNVVKAGTPGILLFAGEMAVGWAQVTPRSALPGLEHGRFTRAGFKTVARPAAHRPIMRLDLKQRAA
ncbi:MAG TPA: hypothetical protein VII56_20425 [Rhizomicrobium sp.]